MTNIIWHAILVNERGVVTLSVNKQDNFRRIAEARTNKIIDSIGLLGNLSNTSYYEYTPEQIDAIFDAIQKELETQKKRFTEKELHKKKFRL